MWDDIGIGMFNMLATVFIHGLAQMLVVDKIKILNGLGVRESFWMDFVRVSLVVLIMFFATLIEAVWWAYCYVFLEALPTPEEAMYFSMVTYTTLGYGDVTLDKSWRILSSFQAANGVLIAGWSTALIIAVLQRVYQARHAAD